MENVRDRLKKDLQDLRVDSNQHTLIKEINQWEKNSIEKIQQTAQQCRDQGRTYCNGFLLSLENKFIQLDQQTNVVRQRNQFDQMGINQLKLKLEKLEGDLQQLTNVSIEQQSTALISRIYVPIPLNRGNLIELACFII